MLKFAARPSTAASLMAGRRLHMAYLALRGPSSLLLSVALYPTVFMVLLDRPQSVHPLLRLVSGEVAATSVRNFTMLIDGLMPPGVVLKALTIGCSLTALSLLSKNAKRPWLVLPISFAALSLAGYPFATAMIILGLGLVIFLTNNGRILGKTGLEKIIDYGPGFGEVLLTPLYLERILNLSRIAISESLLRLLKIGHFFTATFLILLTFAPIGLTIVGTTLNETGVYDIEVDTETGRVFLSIHQSVCELSNGSCVLLFRSPRISEAIELSEERRELYIIDRSNWSLLAIGIDTYELRHIGYDKGLDRGDSRLVSHNGSIVLVNDDPCYLYRFEASNGSYLRQPFYSHNAEIEHGTLANHVFISEWRPNKQGRFRYLPPERCEVAPQGESLHYYLRKLRLEDLTEENKVKVPGPNWDMKVVGNELYATFPFGFFLSSYIYVYDTATLNVIERFRVPFGTRTFAIDSENNLLFAGSTVTNLIAIINLDSRLIKGVVKLEGNGIREMAIDTNRRVVYATMPGGLFQMDYSVYVDQ